MQFIPIREKKINLFKDHSYTGMKSSDCPLFPTFFSLPTSEGSPMYCKGMLTVVNLSGLLQHSH